jgi:hypothetical protein
MKTKGHVYNEPMDEKICSRCRQAQPTTNFYRNARWRDGMHPWCKACFSAACKARYERRCAEHPRSYRWNRDLVRHTYFADVTTPLQAYLLGFLAADGTVPTGLNRIDIELSVKDLDLLAFIRDELAPGHRLRWRTRVASPTRFGSGESVTLSFASPAMVRDLARYGIGPAKSKMLQWPAILPADLARSFILGYFDGDGFITSGITRSGGREYHYHYLGIASGSLALLSAILDEVESATRVRMGGPWGKAGSRCHTIRSSGKSAETVDAWLHLDGLGLARKRLVRVMSA